jgi:hypothetical protein
MDHEAASLLISDWVAQRLSAESATDVATHIAGCAECRGVAESLVAVRGEVAEHGDALWSPHPSADDLARYVSGAATLATDELARLGAHVRACATCTVEARLGREAQAPSAWRWIQAWLPDVNNGRALTTVALGALAVVLAYPAYIGLIEYPKARVHARELERQRTTTQPAPVQVSPPAAIEGPAAVIILQGATRGSHEVLPSVTLRTGQAALPVLIDAAPPSNGALEIVLRDDSGTPRWHMTARGADLWDARQHVLSLLIPASALSSGDFALTIGATGTAAQTVYRFRVTTSGVAPG